MQTIWNNAKSALKEQIPDHSYRMWIEPLEFDRCFTEEIVLSCPNFFSQKRVQSQYVSLIELEIAKSAQKALKIVFEVKGTERHSQEPASVKKDGAENHPIMKPDKDLQLKLPNFDPWLKTGRLLQKNYTFDKFVVGKNNDFAYSAALSLASQKNSIQNSLFLLSNTGMGKTHLSQAMGNHILTQFPSERIFYITAEDFTNEMVYSLQNRSIDKFKDKYRKQCDVLLLEDVHFLTGKDRTQSELALILDYMYESKKKIIFTSCYSPGDIPKMKDQLSSRLSSGLISNIDAPDFHTRVKILRQKAKENNFAVPAEVIEYLAGALTENVRQLESGLNGVVSKSSLLNIPIDLSLAESIVKNIATQSRAITIDVIKNLVSKEFGLSVVEMISKSRKQSVTRPRQVAMYLSRRYTDQPLQAIGKSFNRYHATTLHSIGIVERELKKDGTIKKQVGYLCNKLESGQY